MGYWDNISQSSLSFDPNQLAAGLGTEDYNDQVGNFLSALDVRYNKSWIDDRTDSDNIANRSYQFFAGLDFIHGAAQFVNRLGEGENPFEAAGNTVLTQLGSIFEGTATLERVVNSINLTAGTIVQETAQNISGIDDGNDVWEQLGRAWNWDETRNIGTAESFVFAASQVANLPLSGQINSNNYKALGEAMRQKGFGFGSIDFDIFDEIQYMKSDLHGSEGYDPNAGVVRRGFNPDYQGTRVADWFGDLLAIGNFAGELVFDFANFLPGLGAVGKATRLGAQGLTTAERVTKFADETIQAMDGIFTGGAERTISNLANAGENLKNINSIPFVRNMVGENRNAFSVLIERTNKAARSKGWSAEKHKTVIANLIGAIQFNSAEAILRVGAEIGDESVVKVILDNLNLSGNAFTRAAVKGEPVSAAAEAAYKEAISTENDLILKALGTLTTYTDDAGQVFMRLDTPFQLGYGNLATGLFDSAKLNARKAVGGMLTDVGQIVSKTSWGMPVVNYFNRAGAAKVPMIIDHTTDEWGLERAQSWADDVAQSFGTKRNDTWTVAIGGLKVSEVEDIVNNARIEANRAGKRFTKEEQAALRAELNKAYPKQVITKEEFIDLYAVATPEERMHLWMQVQEEVILRIHKNAGLSEDIAGKITRELSKEGEKFTNDIKNYGSYEMNSVDGGWSIRSAKEVTYGETANFVVQPTKLANLYKINSKRLKKSQESGKLEAGMVEGVGLGTGMLSAASTAVDFYKVAMSIWQFGVLTRPARLPREIAQNGFNLVLAGGIPLMMQASKKYYNRPLFKDAIGKWSKSTVNRGVFWKETDFKPTTSKVVNEDNIVLDDLINEKTVLDEQITEKAKYETKLRNNLVDDVRAYAGNITPEVRWYFEKTNIILNNKDAINMTDKEISNLANRNIKQNKDIMANEVLSKRTPTGEVDRNYWNEYNQLFSDLDDVFSTVPKERLIGYGEWYKKLQDTNSSAAARLQEIDDLINNGRWVDESIAVKVGGKVWGVVDPKRGGDKILRRLDTQHSYRQFMGLDRWADEKVATARDVLPDDPNYYKVMADVFESLRHDPVVKLIIDNNGDMEAVYRAINNDKNIQKFLDNIGVGRKYASVEGRKAAKDKAVRRAEREGWLDEEGYPLKGFDPVQFAYLEVRMAQGKIEGLTYEAYSNMLRDNLNALYDNPGYQKLFNKPTRVAEDDIKAIYATDLNIGIDKRPTIYGIDVHAKSRANAMEALANGIERATDVLSTIPQNELVVMPFYKALYAKELDRILTVNNIDTSKLTLGEMNHLSEQASEFAYREIKRFTYNTNRSTNLEDAARWIFPFVQAFLFQFRFMGRAIVERPADFLWGLGTINKVVGGLDWVDEDGEPVSGDLFSAKKLIITSEDIPFLEQLFPELKEHFELDVSYNSFDMIFGGELTPPIGPAIAIPVNMLAKEHPEMFGKDGFVNDVLLPFGIADNAWDNLLPGYLRNLKETVNGATVKTSARWIETVSQNYKIEHAKYLAGERDKPTIEEIQKQSTMDYFWKTLISFGSPVSFQPKDRAIEDAYNTYSDYISHFGYTEGSARFMSEMPDAYYVLVGANESVYGLPSSLNAVDAVKQNMELVDLVASGKETTWGMMPFLLGLGTDLTDEEYNQAAKAWFESHGPNVAGADYFREPLNPTEVVKKMETKAGWQEYFTQLDELEAKALMRGSIIRKEEDLLLQKKQMIATLSEKFPGWAEEFNNRDYTLYADRADMLTDLVNNKPEMLVNSMGQEGYDSIVAMLTVRNRLILELAKRSQNGGNKTLDAQSNADLKEWYEVSMETLGTVYPSAYDLWNKYFANENVTATV